MQKVSKIKLIHFLKSDIGNAVMWHQVNLVSQDIIQSKAGIFVPMFLFLGPLFIFILMLASINTNVISLCTRNTRNSSIYRQNVTEAKRCFARHDEASIILICVYILQCCDKEMEHKAVIKKWDSPILPLLLP